VSFTIEACLQPSEALKLEVGDLSETFEPAWYTTLNSDRAKPAWFLARDEGVLVGYLTVFDPTGREAEVSAFVAPERRRQGVFTELLARAVGEWGRQRRWLLVVNRRWTSGTAVATLKGVWAFTEFTLALSASSRPAFSGLPGGLTLVEGVAAEAEQASAVLALANGTDDHLAFLNRILVDPRRRFFLLKEGGEAVGVGCLHSDGTETTIHGLAVRPDRQGRGWGRALLAGLLNLGAVHTQEFLIDVDSTNTRAEKLYRSLGFRDRAVTDYYEISVPSAPIRGLPSG